MPLPVLSSAPVQISGADQSGRRPGKSRFALGLFAVPEHVAGAVEDLAASGIPSHVVHLLSNGAAARDLVGADRSLRTSKTPQLARSIECRPATGSYPWSCEFASGASTGSERIDRALTTVMDFRHWALARERVDQVLGTGGGIVVVRVGDDRQQQVVCSVLLRNSALAVQTHDIREPTPAELS